MRSFALLLVASSALALFGCNNVSSGSRDLTGTVQSSGQAITKVIAVNAGTSEVAQTGAVDAAGAFRLSLPTGNRYIVYFSDGTTKVGVLQFNDGNGGKTSLLPMESAPAAGSTPQDASDGSDDDVGLGDVSDDNSDGAYEPSDDPLDQVDSDDDGASDADDADDDNDGVDDSDDGDDDGNGVDDSAEDGDDDGDGLPDDLGEDDGGGEGGSDSSGEGGADSSGEGGSGG